MLLSYFLFIFFAFLYINFWMCFGLYVHCFLCTYSTVFSLLFSSSSSLAHVRSTATTWHQNPSQITLLLQLTFFLNTVVENESKWKQLTRKIYIEVWKMEETETGGYNSSWHAKHKKYKIHEYSLLWQYKFCAW